MNKKLIIFFICFAFIMFFAKEGHVSKIHYENISLEYLVNASSHIFVVKKRDPVITSEEVEIHKNVKKYRPFIKIVYHFKVIEDLIAGNKSVFNGDNISVLTANYDNKLEDYKTYMLERISLSPIYSQYETTADFGKSDKLIVFLIPYDERLFAFIFDGAYEDISKKGEILKLIKEKKINTRLNDENF